MSGADLDYGRPLEPERRERRVLISPTKPIAKIERAKHEKYCGLRASHGDTSDDDSGVAHDCRRECRRWRSVFAEGMLYSGR